MTKRTRDDVVRARIHPARKEAWRIAAAQDGRTVSGWIRWLAELRIAELAEASSDGPPVSE